MNSDVITLAKSRGSGIEEYAAYQAEVQAGEDYLIRITVELPSIEQQGEEEPLQVQVNEILIEKPWLEQGNTRCLEFRFAAIETTLELEIKESLRHAVEASISQLPKRKAGAYPTLFLIGDSTVKTYGIDQYPLAGWGQVLHRFVTPELQVDNRSMGGRSTKLAYREGRLNDLLVDIKPGDYMFIQFAHNDMALAKPERYVTVSQYRNFLSQVYIKGVRQRGAIPVCVTSMNRRTYDEEKQMFIDSFPAYTRAMRETAAEHGLTLLDLNTKSLEFYNETGLAETRPMFMHLKPGEHPNYPQGSVDNTHFREAGAKQIARLLVEELREKLPVLAPYTLSPSEVLTEVFSDTLAYAARDQVELMVRLGVMSGEADGLFHPENDISVTEFASCLARLFGAAPQETALLVHAVTDQPDEPLTRETAAVLGLDMLYLGKADTPPVGSPDEFIYIHDAEPKLVKKTASAKELQLIVATEDGLRPKLRMKKGDAAALLYKLHYRKLLEQ